MKNKEEKFLSWEVYGAGFEAMSGVIDPKDDLGTVTADDLRKIIDQDIIANLKVMCWFHDEKDRMAMVIGSARVLKLSIEDGWKNGVVDETITARVLKVINSQSNKPDDDPLCNGECFAEGSIITFHWQEDRRWGNIYELLDSDRMYTFVRTGNYEVPRLASKACRFRKATENSTVGAISKKLRELREAEGDGYYDEEKEE